MAGIYEKYQQVQQPAPQQNNIGFFQRLLEFKKSFTGDPQQMVMNLLSSGQITQEQYNQAAQQANQLYTTFKL